RRVVTETAAAAITPHAIERPQECKCPVADFTRERVKVCANPQTLTLRRRTSLAGRRLGWFQRQSMGLSRSTVHSFSTGCRPYLFTAFQNASHCSFCVRGLPTLTVCACIAW